MALTNKEKMERKRAKLNINPSAKLLQLERDRLRKRKSRSEAKLIISKNELSLLRFKERERVKKYYYKKKKEKRDLNIQGEQSNGDSQTDSSGQFIPFKSRQSFGKAITKVRRQLPYSPHKRKAVINQIAAECGLIVSPRTKNINSGKGLSEEITKKVTALYESDELSWQAPGKKDRVIYRTKDESTGKTFKTEVQARYMLMSISEAHKIFSEKNPNSIGLAKFSSLRPKHCKLFDSIPHSVCVCAYHENVRLLLLALKEYGNLSTDFRPFIEQIVCDSKQKSCMARSCSVCKDKIYMFGPSSDLNDIPLKYYQWQKHELRTEKLEIISTVKDAFEDLNQQLKHFLIHTYVKRNQADTFEHLKSSVNGSEILLQVDFSENASLIQQNEIQSAHWSHDQATLFTSYSWIKQNVEESCVIVSNDLEHTKLQVYTYMNTIIGHLKKKYPDINTINIFSDGATSQFKQRYNFSTLHLLENQFQVQIKWHFFATSHGKGVVDGIGGSVKRSVWRSVKAGKSAVASAKQFASVAEDRNPNVKIIFIDKSEVGKAKETLECLWRNALPIPNCQSVHFIQPYGESHIFVGEISSEKVLKKVLVNCSENSEAEAEIENEQEQMPAQKISMKNLKEDDWVLVKYYESTFPGIVIKVWEEEAEVSVMHLSSTGSYYKWPTPSDQIIYKSKYILKKICPPTVIGTRGQFKFSFS